MIKTSILMGYEESVTEDKLYILVFPPLVFVFFYPQKVKEFCL